jgi:hypothetical protein
MTFIAALLPELNMMPILIFSVAVYPIILLKQRARGSRE